MPPRELCLFIHIFMVTCPASRTGAPHGVVIHLVAPGTVWTWLTVAAMAIIRPRRHRRLRLFRTAEEIPALSGGYILVIDLAEPVVVTVGRGAPQALAPGRYLYCGSAKGPGGLRARVARHMRRGKPIRWHVDHLTERGAVIGAWIFPGEKECALAAKLSHLPVPISGFGSSDCRRCASHLFVWPEGVPLWGNAPQRRTDQAATQDHALAATGLRASPPSA